VFGVDGHIGPLQVDQSDRADVIRHAGRPDAERSAHPIGYSAYQALGYDCTPKRSSEEQVPIVFHGPYCLTAFFLDGKSGKLEMFFTGSRGYVETRGLRVGMSQAAAERLLHKRLRVGCLAAFFLYSAKAILSVSFSGGIENGTSIKGAHIDGFVLHGMRGGDPGIFDCL
jgi:hypothetical protein